MSMLNSMKQSKLFALRKQGDGEFEPVEQLMLDRGLPIPEQEYRFATSVGRNWRFDYAWPEWKVALEIEGATFGRLIVVRSGIQFRKGQRVPIPEGTRFRLAGGRHATGDGLEEDAHKYNRAAILGWLVVRATMPMVRRGEAIDELLEAFRSRGWKEA